MGCLGYDRDGILYACSQNIPRFPEKYLSDISRLILEISSLTSKVMPDRLCLSNLTLILTLTF